MLDPSKIRRIAINTGGGDAPGLNSVIRAATLAAIQRGWEVFGISHGFRGLIGEPNLMPLTRERVRGIAHLGGSILGTANRDSPFDYPVRLPSGETVRRDISDQVVDNFRRECLDALISIGGDGSLTMAQQLAQKGIPVVGVPKTIDNDLDGTLLTFGFQTAVDTATDAIGKLHTTAEAHDRLMVVEVMGRNAGWIALHAGLAGSADIILIPEIPFDLEKVCAKIREREENGRHFSIVVVAEGAIPVGGTLSTLGPREAGQALRLGGVGLHVANELARKTGKETRSLVLGHLQRGGGPDPFDRVLALHFGTAAIRALAAGKSNVMVALEPPRVKTIPLEEATRHIRTVALDNELLQTARDLGVSLGD